MCATQYAQVEQVLVKQVPTEILVFLEVHILQLVSVFMAHHLMNKCEGSSAFVAERSLLTTNFPEQSLRNLAKMRLTIWMTCAQVS